MSRCFVRSSAVFNWIRARRLHAASRGRKRGEGAARVGRACRGGWQVCCRNGAAWNIRTWQAKGQGTLLEGAGKWQRQSTRAHRHPPRVPRHSYGRGGESIDSRGFVRKEKLGEIGGLDVANDVRRLDRFLLKIELTERLLWTRKIISRTRARQGLSIV